jgi:hypothetical protein
MKKKIIAILAIALLALAVGASWSSSAQAAQQNYTDTFNNQPRMNCVASLWFQEDDLAAYPYDRYTSRAGITCDGSPTRVEYVQMLQHFNGLTWDTVATYDDVVCTTQSGCNLWVHSSPQVYDSFGASLTAYTNSGQCCQYWRAAADIKATFNGVVKDSHELDGASHGFVWAP